VIIRPERPDDLGGIRAVHEAAFGAHGEADLVDALRSDGSLLRSIVAVEDGQVRGHVAASPVMIESQGDALVAGVAPLGVLPAHQRRGIGSALMRAIIEVLRGDGLAGLVLLGDPAYYGRFGFAPASDFELWSHYTDGPAFQAMALQSAAFAMCRGAVQYDPWFVELD
jgi:putative acetyltransferase